MKLISLGRTVASRKGGRPTRAELEAREGTGGTKMIRVNADIADMIGWITELEDITSAVLTDPLLRPAVSVRYKRIEAQVEAIKSAHLEAKRIQSEAGRKPAK